MAMLFRNYRKLWLLPTLLMGWLTTAVVSASAVPLIPGKPILLPGTHGHFDFIRVDASRQRLLLGHEANKSLDVFDLRSKRLLKSVPTGTAQDAAVDARHGNYYVSSNDPGRTVIVNATTLTITGAVPLPAPTDLIAYDPRTQQIHESNDTAAREWVINPLSKQVVATIHLQGRGVEDLAFDPEYHRLFQAVKGSNQIAVIDPTDNKVLHQYALAPDRGPHGIAIVPNNDGLLAACNRHLVLMSRSTGKIWDRADIAPHVDEMAYDPGTHLACCASRRGKISVVRVQGRHLTALGSAPDPQGTGSIAVNPKTHTVWIAFHKGESCYVQPFTASP